MGSGILKTRHIDAM